MTNKFLEDKELFVKRITRWKYAFVAVSLLSVGIILYLVDKNNFSSATMLSNILYSVVTAIFLSLFYDIFTRSEQQAQQDISNEKVALRLERNVITSDAILDFKADEFDSLAQALVKSDEFLASMSRTISNDEDISERLVHSHIRPLFALDKIGKVSVENTLLRYSDDDHYILQCKFKFLALGGKETFRCLITPDNEIINDAIITSHVADEIVGLSEVGWKEVEELKSSIKLQAVAVRNGKRTSMFIEPTILDAETAAKRYPKFSAARYLLVEYSLINDGLKYEYTLDYKVRYSLSDNYYCWFATVPMFVERIVVNYAAVKTLLGKVSAQCFIGNNTGESRHLADECTFEIDVGGLLWPGQGGLIVWRNPNPRGEAAAATPV